MPEEREILTSLLEQSGFAIVVEEIMTFPVLAAVAVVFVVCLGILIRRHQVRTYRKELFILKRHAANYAEMDRHHKIV